MAPRSGLLGSLAIRQAALDYWQRSVVEHALVFSLVARVDSVSFDPIKTRRRRVLDRATIFRAPSSGRVISVAVVMTNWWTSGYRCAMRYKSRRDIAREPTTSSPRPQVEAAPRSRRMCLRRSCLRPNVVGMQITREVQPNDLDAFCSRTGAGCLRKTGAASPPAVATIIGSRRHRHRINAGRALQKRTSYLAWICPLRIDGGRARSRTKDTWPQVWGPASCAGLRTGLGAEGQD